MTDVRCFCRPSQGTSVLLPCCALWAHGYLLNILRECLFAADNEYVTFLLIFADRCKCIANFGYCHDVVCLWRECIVTKLLKIWSCGFLLQCNEMSPLGNYTWAFDFWKCWRPWTTLKGKNAYAITCNRKVLCHDCNVRLMLVLLTYLWITGSLQILQIITYCKTFGKKLDLYHEPDMHQWRY